MKVLFSIIMGYALTALPVAYLTAVIALALRHTDDKTKHQLAVGMLAVLIVVWPIASYLLYLGPSP